MIMRIKTILINIFLPKIPNSAGIGCDITHRPPLEAIAEFFLEFFIFYFLFLRWDSYPFSDPQILTSLLLPTLRWNGTPPSEVFVSRVESKGKMRLPPKLRGNGRIKSYENRINRAHTSAYRSEQPPRLCKLL